jgi:methylated-DNA-protein-cysteine methyltransferase-like protein
MNGEVFRRIRRTVAYIPWGRVTTYGMMAKMVGIKDTRIVGWAIRGNQDPKVPCHRVVNKQGFLATNYSLGGWWEQGRRLREEGISFIRPNQVDLGKHLWEGETDGKE